MKVMREINSESKTRGQVIFNLILVLSNWKDNFKPLLVKIILAKSLNFCVRNKGLKIVGYLMTQKRMVLCIKCGKEDLEKSISLLREEVRREIKKRWPEKLRSEENYLESVTADIFREQLLFNDVLIALITGGKPGLKCYSPYQAKLGDYIRNHKFCSAIDYTGARGPVIMEWQREA